MIHFMNAYQLLCWRLFFIFCVSSAVTYGAGQAWAQDTLLEDGRYQVVSGDTLYSISQRFAVSVDDLIRVNGLPADGRLHIGQNLYVHSPQQQSPSSSSQFAENSAREATTHHVSAGDTLYGIARQYSVTTGQLARDNNLIAPYILFVGQQLVISEYNTASQVSHSSPDITPSAQTSSRLTERPVLTYASAAYSSFEPLKENVMLDTLPPRSSSRFFWPVRGRILSAYGAQESGMRNDGINIAVPLGTEIKAADTGIVSYVGHGVRGFGLLVLITHDDGWHTVYGNTTESYVQTGDKVVAGQPIAAIRETLGQEQRPQLHFEIRLEGRPVDPVRYLTN